MYWRKSTLEMRLDLYLKNKTNRRVKTIVVDKSAEKSNWILKYLIHQVLRRVKITNDLNNLYNNIFEFWLVIMPSGSSENNLLYLHRSM